MSYVYSGPPQTMPKAKGKTPPPPPTLLQIWSTELPAMTLGGYSGLGRHRSRVRLKGLGQSECQVYANGARVCNAVGPAPVSAPAPVSTRMRAWGAFDTGRLTRPTIMPAIMPPVYQSPFGPGPNLVPATPAATPYTTSTVAPIDNTTTPAAPLPVATADTTAATDTSALTTILPSFDFSSIPSWAWYLGLAGVVYFLFFKRR